MTDLKPIESMAAELRKRAKEIEARDSDSAMLMRWAADEIERERLRREMQDR